jgi:hypothetical protein
LINIFPKAEEKIFISTFVKSSHSPTQTVNCVGEKLKYKKIILDKLYHGVRNVSTCLKIGLNLFSKMAAED